MTDAKIELESYNTGRKYKIKRHYTCLSSYCIYLGDCLICKAQYIGQTTSTMQKRHYGHRQEVKMAIDGLGEHFNNHAKELGINVNTELDKIMEYCKITIVASVECGKPWSKKQLDNLEADLEDRIMTLEKHGGINRRKDRRKGHSAQFKKK